MTICQIVMVLNYKYKKSIIIFIIITSQTHIYIIIKTKKQDSKTVIMLSF